MQDFDCNNIKNKYGDKAEMLLTYTDGLMYKIETENVYEDLRKYKELFDLSNCPKDSKYYNGENNLLVGKTKDETKVGPIRGFIWLKSKMYTFITEDNHESKKEKDIMKNVVDDELKYEDYKNVLFNRSYNPNHNIELNRINKIPLSSYDDKKYTSRWI